MENWHTCRYSVTIPGHGSHSQGWCRELLDQPPWCGFGGRLPWTRGHSEFWNRAWWKQNYISICWVVCCLLGGEVVWVTKTETPRAESMTDIAHFSKILADRRIKRLTRQKRSWSSHQFISFQSLLRFEQTGRFTFGKSLKSVGRPIGSRMAGETKGNPVL